MLMMMMSQVLIEGKIRSFRHAASPRNISELVLIKQLLKWSEGHF